MHARSGPRSQRPGAGPAGAVAGRDRDSGARHVADSTLPSRDSVARLGHRLDSYHISQPGPPPGGDLGAPIQRVGKLDLAGRTGVGGDLERVKKNLEQRVEDQAALEKWNISGEGRNQGLVHLIDYAKARPSMAEVQGSGSDKALLRTIDAAGPMTKEAFTKGPKTGSKSEGTGADIRGAALPKKYHQYLEEVTTDPDSHVPNQNIGLTVEEHEALLADQTALVERQGQLDQARGQEAARVKGTLSGKELGAALKEFAAAKSTELGIPALEREIEALEGKKKFALKRDESKRGRLERIAQAGGLDHGIPRGQEITEATRIAEDLSGPTAYGASSEGFTVDAAGAPTRPMSVWDPEHKKAVDKQPDELSHTQNVSVAPPGKGLSIKRWGVLPRGDETKSELERLRHTKLSTVMGA